MTAGERRRQALAGRRSLAARTLWYALHLHCRSVGSNKRLNARPAEVAVVLGERLARYGFGEGHPFGADRHGAFLREFEQRGLRRRVNVLEPRDASLEELQLFHTPAHVQFVQERSQQGVGWLDGGDTPAFRGVFEAAACVVGASLVATEWIMREQHRRAFVPIAGLHHAARDKAAGFCVFNDCGVVIEFLRRAHGLQRIAYVDIDAHHGDGVFYAFEEDPDLIVADLHESGQTLYPGTGSALETGRGAAAGTKLNLPLPAGAGDDEFYGAWPQMLAYVERNEPAFILLQCGADSVAGDPITHLKLSSACHARAARELCGLPRRTWSWFDSMSDGHEEAGARARYRFQAQADVSEGQSLARFHQPVRAADRHDVQRRPASAGRRAGTFPLRARRARETEPDPYSAGGARSSGLPGRRAHGVGAGGLDRRWVSLGPRRRGSSTR